VAHDHAYLHRTYWPTAKLPFVKEDEAPRIGWTRLVVNSHDLGATPDIALVDFAAYYVADDKSEQVLQEKSEFRRVNNEWFYTRVVRSGPAPHRSTSPKVGRNDPCPCGSGKKYKLCCLK
jgi:uncharacterized protein YchJ